MFTYNVQTYLHKYCATIIKILIINNLKMKKTIYFIILTIIVSCNQIPRTNFMCYELIEDLGKMYYNEKIYTGSCFTLYDSNDQQKDEIRSYKRGVMHGIWAKYYENGEIQYVGEAKNGEIHGYYKYYRENGLLAEEGRLNKGQKDRVWKYYNLGGDLEKTEMYKDQTLIHEYYTNEKIKPNISKND